MFSAFFEAKIQEKIIKKTSTTRSMGTYRDLQYGNRYDERILSVILINYCTHSSNISEYCNEPFHNYPLHLYHYSPCYHIIKRLSIYCYQAQILKLIFKIGIKIK